ncbi:MAG: hypothetical protein M3M85_00615 [bacterium]|nr:hypothetical protein [bacterium]
MNGIQEVQAFFIISSVGFVILWSLVGILLYYLIKVTRTFDRIVTKIEGDISKVGDITREMFEEMQGSAVWNFIFRKKRNRRKEKGDSAK